MQTLVKVMLIMLFILIYSGCSTKIVTKTVYVPAPYYEFQTVDFNNSKLPIKYIDYSSPNMKLGVISYQDKNPIYQISLSAKDRLNICQKPMNEEKKFYKKIIKFYEEQIKDYKKNSK